MNTNKNKLIEYDNDKKSVLFKYSVLFIVCYIVQYAISAGHFVNPSNWTITGTMVQVAIQYALYYSSSLKWSDYE